MQPAEKLPGRKSLSEEAPFISLPQTIPHFLMGWSLNLWFQE
jgi:hypothetical protein